MLNLFDQTPSHLPSISEKEMSDEQVIEEIKALKKKLADKVMVLGHHYQQDDIIQFADVTGDSLALAQKAQNVDKPYVIFCGVHFMAETADMLTAEDQKVILPDLNAGCSMADMADTTQIEKAWTYLNDHAGEKIVPITYINCSAGLKAFVGKNGGSICTSSNAKKIISWAFEQGEKLLFFPDQHLGRNTCVEMGISLDEMVIYNPNFQNGGLTPEQIKNAKVILWYGFCSVHQGFTKEQVEHVKKNSPETTVIVHPECSYDVVQAADDDGSTAYIINRIKEAPAGSKFAVGTEINLVNRLNAMYPDKEISSLSPYQCLCTTMYRVRPRWLLASFKGILDDNPVNIIRVSEQVKKDSLLAINRMLELS